jgi:hypothetical protein
LNIEPILEFEDEISNNSQKTDELESEKESKLQTNAPELF